MATHTGTSGNDTVTISGGDSVFADAGDDLIIAATASIHNQNDTIDGGTGNDTIRLTGGGTFNLTSSTVSNIETILLFDDATSSLVLPNSAVASGTTMIIDASAIVTTTNTFTFSQGVEINSSYSTVPATTRSIVASRTFSGT